MSTWRWRCPFPSPSLPCPPFSLSLPSLFSFPPGFYPLNSASGLGSAVSLPAGSIGQNPTAKFTLYRALRAEIQPLVTQSQQWTTYLCHIQLEFWNGIVRKLLEISTVKVLWESVNFVKSRSFLPTVTWHPIGEISECWDTKVPHEWFVAYDVTPELSMGWVWLGWVEFSGFFMGWVQLGRVVLMFIFKVPVVIILQHKKCILLLYSPD